MYDGMITFAIALATSFGLTVPVRRLALQFDMVDRPGPHKVHTLGKAAALGGRLREKIWSPG